jgi:hypothetical protein
MRTTQGFEKTNQNTQVFNLRLCHILMFNLSKLPLVRGAGEDKGGVRKSRRVFLEAWW